ncbi:MAG TPA: MFS transporter [Vicinamibacterales bacterium]|nr:MFS transporter [Vicinamibacterales bacterium]
MRRLPTLPVIVAGIAAFLDLYSTQPLLPLFTRAFGASPFQAGLTITAPTVAIAIFAPFIGRVADRLGLRRVIVGSAWTLALATALAATSQTLGQLIFWRFVQGVATPGIFASAVAYIHEVWPPARAGRATAAYMSGTIIGGFTGRVVAGLVAADVNWHAAFVALAVLTAAAASLIALRLPEEDREAVRRRAAESARASRGGPGVTQLLRNRQLAATCAVGFCVLFTQVAMFTYVTFHVAAPPYSLSTVAIGWLFVVYLVGAIVTPLAGWWIDIYGHRAGIASAMGIGGAGALLTLAPSLAGIVVGLALCSTGVFIAQATTSSYIGAVTRSSRALAVGMYSTFYYAGGSAGGAVPSVVWRAAGWTGCVVLVVAIQALGAAIAFTQWSPAATAPAGTMTGADVGTGG